MSLVCAFILCPLHICPLSLVEFSYFGQMFASARQCAEPMTQHAGSRSRSQLKVTSLSFLFPVCSISPLILEELLLNFSQMFASVRLYAKLVFQPC